MFLVDLVGRIDEGVATVHFVDDSIGFERSIPFDLMPTRVTRVERSSRLLLGRPAPCVVARLSGGPLHAWVFEEEDGDSEESKCWIQRAETRAQRGTSRRPPVCVDRYPMGFGRRPRGRVQAPAHASTLDVGPGSVDADSESR